MTNCLFLPSNCLGGGIGRRAGFKIQFWFQSVGSIPTQGTTNHKKGGISSAACRKHWQDANESHLARSISFFWSEVKYILVEFIFREQYLPDISKEFYHRL